MNHVAARLDRKRAFKTNDRLIDLAVRPIDTRKSIHSLCKHRVYCQSPVKAGERFIKTPKLSRHVATVVMRLGEIRSYRKSPLVTRKRLIKAPEILQRIATVIIRLGEIRSYRQSSVVIRKRFI